MFFVFCLFVVVVIVLFYFIESFAVLGEFDGLAKFVSSMKS